MSAQLEPEIRAALELVARRPLLPPPHMALMLKQDADDLQVRLTMAERLGWLDEQAACCGRQSRYSLTSAGRDMLAASGSLSLASPGK